MKANQIDLIEKSWNNRELLKEKEVQSIIYDAIELLDKGKIRVAEKKNDEWIVN
ncbi:MAG: 2,3,4,5-tetrahydropyridine-2,6-dicarboxylate N-succinyltransferase, partial [Bacteroidales bacterium]